MRSGNGFLRAGGASSGKMASAVLDRGSVRFDSLAEARPVRLLAAGTPAAVAEVRTAMGRSAQVTAAYTLHDALCGFDMETDAIACNVRFDQSRMFDFLQALGEFAFRPPVVCFRTPQPPPLSDALRCAIAEAACALGARCFVDVGAIARAEGREAASAVLRRALLQAACSRDFKRPG